MARKILKAAWSLFLVLVAMVCIVSFLCGLAFQGIILVIFYVFYRLVMKCIDIFRSTFVHKTRRKQNDDEQ